MTIAAGVNSTGTTASALINFGTTGIVRNIGTVPVYLGGSDVVVAGSGPYGGWLLSPGETMTFQSGGEIWGITAVGVAYVSWFEIA